uniref:Uncharacterized protein n=1 Tax=Anguilla anguilla TaxID=7936 RepID=A0A0E9RSU7_ANGAN
MFMVEMTADLHSPFWYMVTTVFDY